jgi:hypothetical protein
VTKPNYEFEQGRPGCPDAIFPVGYNRSKLIEVTTIGDVWQKYLNMATGEIVDTKVFYDEYLAAMLSGEKV